MFILLAATRSTQEPFPGVTTRKHIATRTSAAPRPQGGPWEPAAMRTGTSRVSHVSRGFAKDIRLTYVNEYLEPITIRMGFDSPGHRDVLFSGSRTVTIPARSSITSDPIDVQLRPKQVFWTTTYTAVPATGDVLTIQRVFGLDAGSQEWTGEGDLTLSGSSASGVLAKWQNVRVPTRITGMTTTETISLAVGCDSIGQDARSSWPMQWADNAEAAWTFYGMGGEAMAYMFDRRGVRYGTEGLSQHTHYLCQLGVNDMGRSPLPLAEWVEHWTWAANQGVKVIQSTILPFSSSTDGWTTLAGQTPVNNANRVVFNQWIRDGAPLIGGAPAAPGATGALRAGQAGHPLWKIIDVCPVVESSQDSGMWKTVAQIGLAHGDGLHPSLLGQTLIANALSAGFFL